MSTEMEPAKPDRRPDRPTAMEWSAYSAAVSEQWIALLDRDPEEPEVQEFLELHPSMVPGGSGDIGPGGHHGPELSACFRRPTLKGERRSFEPDFMWVTRSTSTITPILVEIEKPSKRWFKKDRRGTAHLTEALGQLNDWRVWFSLPANQAIFRETFLFEGTYSNRRLEPQYVLVYGRGSEFTDAGGHADPDALRYERASMRKGDEYFLTFDSLIPRFESRHSITVTMSPVGPRPHAFSPTFGTSAGFGATARRLGDPKLALERSVMMSEERKEYLAERWQYWAEEDVRAERAKDRFRLRQGGWE